MRLANSHVMIAKIGLRQDRCNIEVSSGQIFEILIEYKVINVIRRYLAVKRPLSIHHSPEILLSSLGVNLLPLAAVELEGKKFSARNRDMI